MPFGSFFFWSPIAPSGASSDPSDPEALLAPEKAIGDHKKKWAKVPFGPEEVRPVDVLPRVQMARLPIFSCDPR